MFVFAVERECGGLGDRLVGLVSAYIISLFAKRDFKICFTSPDISSVLQVHPDLDFTKVPENQRNQTRRMFVIDQLHELKEFFTTKNLETEWKSHPIIAWYGNQYIHHFLWSNPHYAQEQKRWNLELLTREVYQSLFTRFFMPTPLLTETLTRFMKDNDWNDSKLKHVGVQVRLGDHQIAGCNLYSSNTVEKQNKQYFMFVCKQLADRLPTSKDFNTIVYVATDGNPQWIQDPEFQEIWQERKAVTFNGGPVQHLDKQNAITTAGLLKLMMDLFMLSRCEYMMIPHHSNIARVASLTSVSREPNHSFLYTVSNVIVASIPATDALLFTKHTDGRRS